MKIAAPILSSAFLALAGFAPATTLVFNLDTVYTGITPGGPAPWVTITITDVAANKVNLRVDHNTGGTSGQYVASVYLNMNPFIGTLIMSNEVNANKRNGAILLAENGINGAAGNVFDFELDFKTSNAGGGVDRLKPGEFWSADLFALGLSANTFREWNNLGNDSGSHIQGIPSGGGTNSSHVTTSSPVPEPASMAALAVGALALIRRRKR